ncbi:hypothetical protein LIER_29555 [Lithospermum erythrorhizon]|uniref:Uncharacterized protein n=1 Tax=Lithospermum erythrorhizon TaxID=34254 RepID=A0AAV3RJI1_LITER
MVEPEQGENEASEMGMAYSEDLRPKTSLNDNDDDYEEEDNDYDYDDEGDGKGSVYEEEERMKRLAKNPGGKPIGENDAMHVYRRPLAENKS